MLRVCKSKIFCTIHTGKREPELMLRIGVDLESSGWDMAGEFMIPFEGHLFDSRRKGNLERWAVW